MNAFIKAIEKFTQAQAEQDLLNIFDYLPKDIQEKRKFYTDEMFVNPENHTFYILTSLFIDWIFDLREKEEVDKIDDCLEEIFWLFEMIDDEISPAEQKEVIHKTQLQLNEITLRLKQ